MGISIAATLNHPNLQADLICTVTEEPGFNRPTDALTSNTPSVALSNVVSGAVFPSSARVSSSALAGEPSSNSCTFGLWVTTRMGVNCCPRVRFVIVTS